MQLRIKQLVGLILATWFFFWGLAFHFEPERRLSNIMTDYGVTPDVWVILFLLASLLTLLHLLFRWRWNIIILAPFILHTSAMVFLKVGEDFAPLESVVVRLTLLALLLIEIYVDWRIRWKSLS